MYKTSFNGLVISTHGIYSAYNLTQDEVASIIWKFGVNNINGSNGNYTIFKDAKRKVLLQLYVHDIWLPITFDIRDDLLKIYKSNKIYKKNIDFLSEKLKEMRIQIHVEYDSTNKTWSIVDYPKFLELIKEIISE